MGQYQNPGANAFHSLCPPHPLGSKKKITLTFEIRIKKKDRNKRKNMQNCRHKV